VSEQHEKEAIDRWDRESSERTMRKKGKEGELVMVFICYLSVVVFIFKLEHTHKKKKCPFKLSVLTSYQLRAEYHFA
jgi:hypothetical protein